MDGWIDGWMGTQIVEWIENGEISVSYWFSNNFQG